MSRPRWILELHPDFTDPERLLPLIPDAIVLDARQPLGLERLPPLEGPVVAYGTLRRMQHLLRLPVACEGVLDHHGELRCSRYYPHIYPWLGRAAVFAPLCALPHLPLHRMLGDAVFVRPDDNTKPFSAEILATQPADAVAEFVRRHSEHGSSLVVLSEVVVLGDEYRCFVRRGQVFAHSSYLHPPPYRPAPPAVRAFAAAVARALLDTLGLTMLTVDVAQHGEHLRLVEVGGVCSWGLYGADPLAFIAAMEAEARQRHDDLAPPP